MMPIVKKWILVSSLLGAIWMLVLIWTDSLRWAVHTNYLAFLLAGFVFNIGLTPRTARFALYAFLVVSSAIEWGVIGIALRLILKGHKYLRTTIHG